MSSAPSETETLLPTLCPPSPSADRPGLSEDTPVEIPAFLRNVKLCRKILACLLPLAVLLEALHLGVCIAAWLGPASRSGVGLWDIRRECSVDLASLIALVWATTLFLRTAGRSPLSNPKHRTLCAHGFALLVFPLVLHPLPYIVTSIITHRSPPSLPLSLLNIPLSFISRGRTVVLALAVLAVGSMRRGPQMHVELMKLGTGFGINAEREDRKVKAMMDTGLESTDRVDGGRETDPDRRSKPNVYDWDNSSVLSFITLSYVSGLARRSLQVDYLRYDDLPHLGENIRNAGGQDDPASQTDLWLGKTGEMTQWRLFTMLWRGRGWTVFVSLVIETLRILFSFFQAVSLHQIIASFAHPEWDRSYAHLMCWGLFVGQSAEVLLGAYACVRENYLLHIPVRFQLSSMLFAKVLRSADARAMEAHNVSDHDKEQGKGRSQVMNLLTIDVNTIASMATKTWNLSNSLISLMIGVTFLWSMLGVSALVGIACIPLSGPMSAYVMRSIYRCDKMWARCRDARTGAIKEFLLGYKVIKLNAFEDYFERNIQRLRDIEVIWQRWRYTLGTLFNILADQLPPLAIAITFFFHTKVLGRPLDPATAFVALSIFHPVKDGLQMVPATIQGVLVSKVALGRLVSFFNQPEIDPPAADNPSDEVSFQHATIAWPAADMSRDDPSSLEPFKLHDVHMNLPIGKFTLICGPLGSGKTLLLRGLLGEARVEEGAIFAPRTLGDATPLNGNDIHQTWTTETWLTNSIAYAPQQAYIRHGTLRDNILFGQPMWRERYREALRQASLLPDLEILPDGDLTELGDHGINLSGGQKARINLARCIYSRAKTVYLDDILSAVDAHTSQFIFKECLAGGLLKGRTVVLVTHHVGLCLPEADFIVLLKDGKVEQACPASEANVATLPALPQVEQEEEQQAPAKVYRERDEDKQISRQVYTTEESAVGRVKMSHYRMVLTAAGGWSYWLVLALIYGINRAAAILATLALQRWSSDADPSHLDGYLSAYLGLVTLGALAGGFRWAWLYGIGKQGFYNRGSRKIHEDLVHKVCGAPLAFFESVPAGRIMNVFGQDMARLDGWVADDFGRTLSESLDVITSSIIVCLEAPILLFVLLIIGPPFYLVNGMLRKFRADLRRLTAVAGSPLITLYHDAIDGVVMIRAFGSSAVMMASLRAFINREREAGVMDWTVFNWTRAVIRSIASVVITACGFVLVNREMTGAQAGFILAFATTVSQGVFGLMEQYSSLEQTFVSAERVNQYIQMPYRESSDGRVPSPSWPAQGRISISDLSIRYAPDLPEVLHGISLDIEPGMRVGLVGATGSGKSTLALSLFRALEPHSGNIKIDGIDIMSLEVHELRKRLNMVVQDGSLCSGSLRDALDITGTKDDHEIYEALRRVHLIPEGVSKEELKKNPFADLETFVAIEGANFSQGQRQLLCLARALLKPSKVLVMDEATSSVDFEMDAKITATIKECFVGTTLLVIAHRLATIMHFDRVLVLGKGRVLEYDSPLKLVENPSSAFHALCMAQGQEEFDKLLAMARA